jgi:hypothetical protein
MANVMDSATDENRVAISSFKTATIGYDSIGETKLNSIVWAVRYHTRQLGTAVANGDEWFVAYHTGALLRLTEGW